MRGLLGFLQLSVDAVFERVVSHKAEFQGPSTPNLTT